MLVVAGATLLTMTTAANASVQLAAGDAMRGRVMALYILVFLGGTPLGAPLVGALVQAAGPRSGLVAGGAASAATALGALLLLRRRQPGQPAAGSYGQVSSQPASTEARATSRAREAASRSATDAAEPRSPAASSPASLPTAAVGAAVTGTVRMPPAS